MTTGTSSTRRATVRMLAAAALAAVMVTGTAAAAGATRRPAPVWLPTTTLDLARMTIRATDLPGQGYGTNDGSVYANLDGGTEFSSSIGLADPADPDRMVRRINSSVETFADAASAQADIDRWRPDLGGATEGPEIVIEGADTGPRQIVPDAPVFGDDSVTTTFTGSNTGGGTANVIEVTVRADRLVGSVSISDFRGSAPSVDEVLPFGEELVRRMRDGLAANWVGMFHRMVRFDDSDPWRARASETYTMLDGTFVPFLGSTPESMEQSATFLTSSRVIDAYTYSGTLENDSDGRILGHTAWIYSFATAEDAAAYLEPAADNAMPVHATAARATPPALGAAASAISYTDTDGSSGHRIWVQSGTEVVSVDAWRTDGLTLEAVGEFAALQLGCAQLTEVCPATPVPPSLLG